MARFPISERFWSASEARANQDRGRAPATSKSKFRRFARKEELWSQKAEHYLRGHKGLASRFSGIRVDPKLQRMVLDLMGDIAPALQSAYDKHLGRLAFSAWRQWPHDTGLSASMIGLEYTVESGGTTFKGSLFSRAPYTVFIKGHPHRKFIDQPSRTVAENIAADALATVGSG